MHKYTSYKKQRTLYHLPQLGITYQQQKNTKSHTERNSLNSTQIATRVQNNFAVINNTVKISTDLNHWTERVKNELTDWTVK